MSRSEQKETGNVFEEAYEGLSEASELMTCGPVRRMARTFLTTVCSEWSAASNAFCWRVANDAFLPVGGFKILTLSTL